MNARRQAKISKRGENRGIDAPFGWRLTDLLKKKMRKNLNGGAKEGAVLVFQEKREKKQHASSRQIGAKRPRIDTDQRGPEKESVEKRRSKKNKHRD